MSSSRKRGTSKRADQETFLREFFGTLRCYAPHAARIIIMAFLGASACYATMAGKQMPAEGTLRELIRAVADPDSVRDPATPDPDDP